MMAIELANLTPRWPAERVKEDNNEGIRVAGMVQRRKASSKIPSSDRYEQAFEKTKVWWDRRFDQFAF
jgi:hypothetical protein